MSQTNKPNPSHIKKKEKPLLLLHICCAPCATHVIELLKRDFVIAPFFYNPNIQPEREFKQRKDEAQRLASMMGFNLVCLTEGQEEWLDRVKGFENEPEGGKRCEICYQFRLDKSAQYAEEEGIPWLATTLSISPHKKAAVINAIGNAAAKKYGINFFNADFKKKNGFKISCELSEKYQLYRQDYCGCLFSLNNKSKSKPIR